MSEETPEQTPYLVMISIPSSGYDPVDAVQKAMQRIAIEGLANQRFRVVDLEDDETYIVDPNTEEYEEYGEPTFAEHMEEITDLLVAISDRGVEDEPEPEYTPDPNARPIVDVELPEPEKPKAKRKSHGTCKRCKTEDVDRWDLLCKECLLDTQGAEQ